VEIGFGVVMECMRISYCNVRRKRVRSSATESIGRGAERLTKMLDVMAFSSVGEPETAKEERAMSARSISLKMVSLK
jgi:hypothetical protein